MAPLRLYTCPAGKHGAGAPLVKHPCGVAAKALDEAGHQYELQGVGGFKHVPFSRRGRRDEIVAMTGQEDVPVLLLDDGTTVQGSRRIVEWVAANPVR
jgi:glutathione S-transferase